MRGSSNAGRMALLVLIAVAAFVLAAAAINLVADVLTH